MKYKKKNMIKLIVITEVLGLLVLAYDIAAACSGVTSLNRPESGSGEAEEKLTAQLKGETDDVTVLVSEVYESEEEQRTVLEQAKKEIDESFCGENTGLDHIDQSVTVKSSYVDGKVSAEWVFSDYSVMNSEGTLQYDSIDGPVTVQAEVTLSYQNLEDVYLFDFMVYPANMDTEEGRAYFLSKSLEDADAADPENDLVRLPDEIEGVPVSFQKAIEARGAIIMALGILILVMMPLLQQEQERERESKRQQQLLIDYPRIVSQMSLYISAGVSLQNTVNRMVAEYNKRLEAGAKQRPGYEELKLWCNEVKTGQSEAQAFSNLGRRCNNPDYKKLVMLLEQNMKKGTRGLAAKLEMEEQRAFEQRKDMAKKKGEEASTKLLLPMIGMLGIILVILIFPAFMQMNG